MGKRKGSHAAGLYSFPGGHLDFGESWANGIIREKNEECGEQFKIALFDFGQPLYGRPHERADRPELFVTNDVMPQYNKHYITIYMVGEWVEGEPLNMEPHKNEGWVWNTFDELKEIAKTGSTAEWIPIDRIEQFRHVIGF